MSRWLRVKLTHSYDVQVGRAEALKRHPGLSRFTVNYLEPKLRAELDRRILSSADLIKLNRQKAIDTTLSRFSGWSSSIPATESIALRGMQGSILETARHIQKSAENMDYEARRVMIDQNRKLIANIDNVIATSNNAIAAEWHSHWRRPGYDYREDHKERDRLFYLIRGNWAQKNGYVKAGQPVISMKLHSQAKKFFASAMSPTSTTSAASLTTCLPRRVASSWSP